ncbi:MAG: helix-turn-helix domain-containing protein [Bacteroidota bacterium]
MNKRHKGQIIEKVVRGSGYTLVQVAKRVGVSRSTLYNAFEQESLNSSFITKLGRVIHYDFRKDFPELAEDEGYMDLDDQLEQYKRKIERELSEVQKKYYQVLEEYNKLLHFLVRIANNSDLYTLKKEISRFTEGKEF